MKKYIILPLFNLFAFVAGCSLEPVCENDRYACVVKISDTSNCIDSCTKSANCPEECFCGEDDSNCELIAYSDKYDEVCQLYQCINHNWVSMNETCKYGWSKQSSNQCLPEPPECTSGEKYIAQNAEGQEGIEKCVDGRKDPKTFELCEFGVEGTGNDLSCIDPCKICRQSDTKINCNQLYSEKTGNIYTCDDLGWKRDYSCTNNFKKDKAITVDTESFARYLNNHLPEYVTNQAKGETELYMGTCGECNQEQSPEYCTEVDGEMIHRRCENGEWLIGPAEDDEICEENEAKHKEFCVDDYGKANLVNLNSNRYHCGSCDNACSKNQICIEGTCEFNFVCGEDNFATVQVGSRTVKAYCVYNNEEFTSIAQKLNNHQRDPNNYDNAYVLMDNLVLEANEWDPIGTEDNPFTGIIFGNNKKITMNTNITQQKTMGLFGYVTNSYIENLTLHYAHEANYNVDNGEIYFGALAGHIKDSILSTISLNNIDIKIDLENSKVDVGDENYAEKVDNQVIKVGSLVGYAYNSKFNDLEVKSNVQVLNGQKISVGGVFGEANKIVLDACVVNVNVKGQNITSSSSNGIGGIIGVAYNIVKLHGIKEKSTGSIHVDGAKSVGGIIGRLKQSSINGEISNTKEDPNDDDIILNPTVTGSMSFVGGLFGHIDSSTAKLEIRDFKLGTSKIILDGETDETKSFLSHNTKNGYNNRYFGGAFGLISGNSLNREFTSIDNITIDKYQIDTPHTTCTKNSKSQKCSGYMGGCVGHMKYASMHNIEVNEIEFIENENHRYDFRWHVGGLAGYISNSNLQEARVSNFRMIELLEKDLYVYYIAALVGWCTNSEISGESHDSEISVYFGNQLAGLVGHAIASNIHDSIVDNVIIKKSNEGTKNKNISGLIAQIDTGSNVNRCSVNNIKIVTNRTDNVGGLIGELKDSSIVSDCTADNSNITVWWGASLNAGGLIGYIENSNIINSEVNNTFLHNSGDNTGGVAGKLVNGSLSGVKVNETTLEALDSSLKTEAYLGGLLGYADNAIIQNASSSKVSVTNANVAGGMIGFANTTTISDSFASTNISPSSTNAHIIGGLIGKVANNVNINRTISTLNYKKGTNGTIPGNEPYVGGIAGEVDNKLELSADNSITILNIPSDLSSSDHIGNYFGAYLDNSETDEYGRPLNGSNIYSMNSYSINSTQIPIYAKILANPIADFGIYNWWSVNHNRDYLLGCYDIDAFPCECWVFGTEGLPFLAEELNNHICDCTQTDTKGTSNPEDNERLSNYQCTIYDLSIYNEPYNMNYPKPECTAQGGYVMTDKLLCDEEFDSEPQIETECTTSNTFNDYTCSIASFKESIQCEDTECDDLIKLLCNGANTCESFTLPFPEGIVPTWCTRPEQPEENTDPSSVP